VAYSFSHLFCNPHIHTHNHAHTHTHIITHTHTHTHTQTLTYTHTSAGTSHVEGIRNKRPKTLDEKSGMPPARKQRRHCGPVSSFLRCEGTYQFFSAWSPPRC